jgi:hypothetical protein
MVAESGAASGIAAEADFTTTSSFPVLTFSLGPLQAINKEVVQKRKRTCFIKMFSERYYSAKESATAYAEINDPKICNAINAG